MTKRPVSVAVYHSGHPCCLPNPEERRKEEVGNAAATGWSNPSEGCRPWAGVQINVALMLAICPQVIGDRNSKSLSLMNEHTMTVLCVAEDHHIGPWQGKSGTGLSSANLAKEKSRCLCVCVCVPWYSLISEISSQAWCFHLAPLPFLCPEKRWYFAEMVWDERFLNDTLFLLQHACPSSHLILGLLWGRKLFHFLLFLCTVTHIF